MCRFMKPNVMKDIKSVDKLLDVNVDLDANHLDHTKVDLGFSAERITKQLSTNRQATQLKVLEYTIASKKCFVSIVKKPLEYSLTTQKLPRI